MGENGLRGDCDISFCQQTAEGMMSKYLCIGLFIALALQGWCTPRFPQRYKLATDENGSTIQLRDSLIEFAKGKKLELSGNTEANEGFILFYGYEPESLQHLPVSNTLCNKLEQIRAPVDIEIYVLVRYRGDDVVEYTQWQLNTAENWHPNLIQTPFLIRGNPYKITQSLDEYKRVVMELSN
jgi:hypothetical protein